MPGHGGADVSCEQGSLPIWPRLGWWIVGAIWARWGLQHLTTVLTLSFESHTTVIPPTPCIIIIIFFPLYTGKLVSNVWRLPSHPFSILELNFRQRMHIFLS